MAFEVERVVGLGNVQELICQTISLGTSVEEIKQITKTVIIDSCKVVFDKVIIDGRLRKDIMFKEANCGFPLPGTVQGCAGITQTITGQILDMDVEIAFIALIPVPGALPTDRCVVLQAFVEGEQEEPANIQQTGAFCSLVDKSIVFVCVKVVRETITNNLQTTMGQQDQMFACPERRSTGFFPGGNGMIPPARPGPFKGTWIGPTLIFGGVLNPGIPTVFPPTNQIATSAGSQVQVMGMQPTTTAGGVTTFGGTVLT